MSFKYSQRKRESFDYLANEGMLPGVTPPPVQQPPVMPMDIAIGHNLPTNNANIISQMYGDTRPAPSYTPTQAQIQNAFQTAPMQTFAPPGVPGNEFMSQQWQIANDP